MSEKIYKAAYGHDGLWYADGPGNGCGYYGGTLWPNLRCDTEQEADRIAEVANIAYQEGYRRAQADIQIALGVKP